LAVSPVAALQESDLMLFKSQTEGDHVVATKETIFHAQGGGQPSDSGVMIPKGSGDSSEEGGGSFEVCSVRRSNNGRILHYGRFNPAGKDPFDKDSSVQQIIDGEKRDLHSRIHTAGHLLGLAVRQLADSIPNVTESKAQHYPDSAFVEFQGLIDGRYKDTVQEKLDELVKEALPVTVRWFDQQETREKCVQVPDNFNFDSGELTRAVEVAGLGAYPCGGTHVTDTSQIGAVEVKKISRQKGKSKISYGVK
jgi:Ser-tRNA(Ala) deacylase AlaX